MKKTFLDRHRAVCPGHVARASCPPPNQNHAFILPLAAATAEPSLFSPEFLPRLPQLLV